MLVPAALVNILHVVDCEMCKETDGGIGLLFNSALFVDLKKTDATRYIDIERCSSRLLERQKLTENDTFQFSRQRGPW